MMTTQSLARERVSFRARAVVEPDEHQSPQPTINQTFLVCGQSIDIQFSNDLKYLLVGLSTRVKLR